MNPSTPTTATHQDDKLKKPPYIAPDIQVWNSEELTQGAAVNIPESNNGYFNS